MLSAFSWGDFAQCTLIILLCYYLAIGVIFYRAELLTILSDFRFNANTNLFRGNAVKNTGEADKKKPEESLEREERLHQPKTQIPANVDISKVYVEVEEVIATAKQKGFSRAQIIETLVDIIRKFINTGDKELAETVSMHIQSQLTIYSFQPLTVEELDQLWSK
jgi:hypothetical protein